MALSLPYTLAAGSPENINQVQANFDAISNSFPLTVNTSNFSVVPQCRVTANAVTSITNNTWTAVNWNQESFDTGTPSNNMHDTGSNTSRLTCRVAGLYSIYTATSAALNSSALGIRFLLNGTTVIAQFSWGGVAAQSTMAAPLITHYRLAVSDYVEVQAFQNSGGAVNTSNAEGQHFGMTLVSV